MRGRQAKASEAYPTMRALLWFLGLMVLALASIAVFTYPAWLLLHPHFNFPFHRIGERIAMLALLLGFIAVARRLGLADRVSLGYGLPRRAFVRELALGLALGVITMLAVVGIMTLLGLLDWSSGARLGAGALAELIALRALSGLAVGFIEETFLRGAMQTAITRQAGTRTAISATALIYAAQRNHTARRHAAGIRPAAGYRRCVPGAGGGGCRTRPGAGCDRQHRRLHRTALRLGLGDVGGARTHAAESRRAARLSAQPLRRLHRLAGAVVDAAADRATVALLRRAQCSPAQRLGALTPHSRRFAPTEPAAAGTAAGSSDSGATCRVHSHTEVAPPGRRSECRRCAAAPLPRSRAPLHATAARDSRAARAAWLRTVSPALRT